MERRPAGRPRSNVDRLLRARVLEALERRVKQFKSYENIWPFRIPHEPLALADIIDETLADDEGAARLAGARASREMLRSRTVIEMRWAEHAWEAWAVSLASGIIVYCDDDGEEARVLASAKRGNPLEADGFFLELLAETRGQAFGMEMAGDPPARVRTSVADRDFLIDVFVDLFEGSAAEASLLREIPPTGEIRSARDFRADVSDWLTRTLAPPPDRDARRQPRRRDESPFG